MNKSPYGKAAILGASEGLGLAVIQRFLKSNWSVFFSSRNEAKLERISGTLKVSGEIHHASGDLSTREGARKVIDTAMDLLDCIDCLVILVGGYGEDDIKNFQQLDSMLESHVRIPIIAVSAAIDFMKTGSSIVLVSSTETLGYPDPNKMSYSIAKSSLNRLTESLASQLLKEGIRVNAVAPSYIHGTAEEYMPGNTENPAELIANVIFWLASSDSVLVNGEIIAVDGGNRLKHTRE